MATTVTLKPNAIDISGSTSGTTTLQATAVAGTTTLTLPAATDTLVGKATTDTLTNKTLTGAVMNGTLGATTPSTVAATSVSYTTTLTGGTGVIAIGTNQIYKDASGNVGLGTASPAGKLEVSSAANVVYSTGTAGHGAFYARGSGTNSSYSFYGNATSGEQGRITIENGGAFIVSNTAAVSERMRIDSSGNLLVRTTSQAGAAVLTVKSSGTVSAGNGIAIVKNDSSDYWSQNVDSLVGYTFGKNGSDFWYAGRSGSNNCVSNNGSWVNSSDERLKENIEPLKNCLQDVCKLQGVSFTRINGGQEEIGLIAQEVEKVFPRAVEPPLIDTDNYALNYGSLVAPLIEAIKEQQALIQSLTTRITALETP